MIGHNQVPDPFHKGEFGGADHHRDPGSTWDWPRYMAYLRLWSGQTSTSPVALRVSQAELWVTPLSESSKVEARPARPEAQVGHVAGPVPGRAWVAAAVGPAELALVEGIRHLVVADHARAPGLDQVAARDRSGQVGACAVLCVREVGEVGVAGVLNPDLGQVVVPVAGRARRCSRSGTICAIRPLLETT